MKKKREKNVCVCFTMFLPDDVEWYLTMTFDGDITMVHDGIWWYLIILWLIWLHFDGSWS
jgi:hypothetical protein